MTRMTSNYSLQNKRLLIGAAIKATNIISNVMGMEYCISSVEVDTKESGKTIKCMVSASFITKIAL